MKCPVCEGKGKVSSMVSCHGCAGKGWVEVSEAKLELSPFEEPKVIDINISIQADKIDAEFIGKLTKLLTEGIGRR